MVTSTKDSFQFALLPCFVVSAIFGTVPDPLFSIIRAALPRAVLQAITEPLWYPLVKMKNQILEMVNGLGTGLIPVQSICKKSAVRTHVRF